jgi:hypothetical protein
MGSDLSKQFLTESGFLRVRVTEDFVLDGGAWKPAGEQKGRLIATITPPATPMFQQVVEYLETKPLPPGGATKRDGEARAAVALCLRWRSYFAVLADPSRPGAPHIADEEMARMNIEISAALAWWLTLRNADEHRYDDLVHRALAYLPTGPKAVSALQSGEILMTCTVPEMVAHVRRSWPADRLDRDLETATKHGIAGGRVAGDPCGG